MGKNTLLRQLTGLAPYTGEWTIAQAGHLLRRTTFGPGKAELIQAVEQGLAATVAALVAEQPAPEPPVYYNYDGNPDAPNGSTWVNAHYFSLAEERGPRNNSYRSWLVKQLREDRTITEKMTLFWQNHFGVTYNGDPLARYSYNALLRSQATGNFKTLLQAVTLHPAMLSFLNGNQNSRTSPNENYGRELLELFTVGKGAQIAEGDYTNYTETDVRELARALTGWVNRGLNSTIAGNSPRAEYVANRHDTNPKQLSYHFDNRIIENGDDQEYLTVIDILTGQLQTARHLCRKLYRFFVYYDITEQEEMEIIEPLAQLLYDNDYDVRPVLTTLLSSEHFYDNLNRGPMIKNPLDFALSILRPFGYEHTDQTEVLAQATLNLRLLTQFNNMGMDYFSPPTVSGWEAWYQAPVYTRSWINGSTLQIRTQLVNTFTGNGYLLSGVRFRFQYVEWLEQLENPADINSMIAEITSIFLPKPLEQVQLDALKEFVIPGLPDFEWSDEYGAYLGDPGNEMLYNGIEAKLKILFKAIFNLAEFHLS